VSASSAELIRQWIAFADAGFAGDFLRFFSPDYAGHLGRETHDLTELMRLERQFAAAFSVTRTIEDLLVDGDKVAARIRSNAVHVGDFYGRGASHRVVTFTAIVIYHVVDGRIRESWGEVDFAGLMRQLPPPAQAGA
jgi:predicted ester cyclase